MANSFKNNDPLTRDIYHHLQNLPPLTDTYDNEAKVLCAEFRKTGDGVYISKLFDLISKWLFSIFAHSASLTQGYTMEEIISESWIALQLAVEQYDETKGTFLRYFINKLKFQLINRKSYERLWSSRIKYESELGGISIDDWIDDRDSL